MELPKLEFETVHGTVRSLSKVYGTVGAWGFLGQAWSMHGDEASSLDGLIIVRLGCHQC